jgi:hypothetical protein
MLVAPFILAATLGQACPEPPSRYGPPPCAAANVPGCLPGYRKRIDDWGRVTYVCDPSYYQQQSLPPPASAPYPAESQQAWAAPAPAPAPRYAPQYAPPPYTPQYAPPYSAPYAPRPAEPRGLLGIVFMPGATTPLDTNRTTVGTGALALELRAPTGGARLRFSLEYASFGHLAEVALKYDFNDRGQIRPFLALAVGGASVDPDPAWRLEGTASAGLDLYLSRNFFLTFEAKRRAFTQRSDSAAFGLDSSSLRQTAFFGGVGLYL